MQAFIDWIQLLALASFLAGAQVLQTLIIITYNCFPFPSLLDRLFLTSKSLQGWFSYRLGLTATDQKPLRPTADQLVRNMCDGVYDLESHTVDTEDGFVLVMHRIVPKHDLGGEDGKKRPPVLLLHALMQDSESFLAGGEKHSLAIQLAKSGFDVWLGNNRGNRYSHKHRQLSPSDRKYWDYCIDDLAKYDLPALISHVLATTGASQLRYIGFSQGSAQAFAAFVRDQSLAAKIKIFIAVAPPPRAKGLSASILTSLVQTNPRFIFLLFGRRAMLSSTLLWMRIMSPRMFVRAVDVAVKFLFGWAASQVNIERKDVIYQHIFSYTSVKNVTHWFQLIKLRRLAMYQDTDSTNRIPVEYELSRMKVPVALIYGERDTVIDIQELMKVLPNVVHAQKEECYEHLDCIWADSAPKVVFPTIINLLRSLDSKSH